MRSQFSIRRRDNHALGVTLGRYIIIFHFVQQVMPMKRQMNQRPLLRRFVHIFEYFFPCKHFAKILIIQAHKNLRVEVNFCLSKMPIFFVASIVPTLL